MSHSPLVASPSIDQPICFVIMPFTDPPGYPADHFKNVYTHIFQPAIRDAGYYPVRCDEITNNETVHSNMFKMLESAEMVLCDLSSFNPNVLYELGRRHCCGKPVVLVQENSQERLFNIIEYQVTHYHQTRRYEEVLEDRQAITKALQQITLASNSSSNVPPIEWMTPLELRTDHYKNWDAKKQRANCPSLQIEASSTAFLSNSSRDQLVNFVLNRTRIRTRLFQSYDKDTRKFAQETLEELHSLMHNFSKYNARDDQYYDIYSEATDLRETLIVYLSDQLVNFLRSSSALTALVLHSHDSQTKAYVQAKLEELNDLMESFEKYCTPYDRNFADTYHEAERLKRSLINYLV